MDNSQRYWWEDAEHEPGERHAAFLHHGADRIVAMVVVTSEDEVELRTWADAGKRVDPQTVRLPIDAAVARPTPPTAGEGWGLRDALHYVATHGFGENVDADSTIEEAASGLLALYDNHGLRDVSGSSAADQCADLYTLMNSVGLVVA